MPTRIDQPVGKKGNVAQQQEPTSEKVDVVVGLRDLKSEPPVIDGWSAGFSLTIGATMYLGEPMDR